ncbi:septum formation protein Maf [Parvularcula flava]|uniref:dTTP/UTP pyrophosphatase n=1 Tax=Aquisalinus luteolus TaxID=1566827 RepID=A0A8J3ERR3_9PROT|nr:nucleoside triphosphate pyrophosphatase [Aquisalinus luteolus]NHK29229.1 septum formation protein Maf [Aquisalinus luteolus]GGH99898.1 Maf-like protein [Aquisalinus luteolus]
MSSATPRLILASQSPRRRDLLAMIGVVPDSIEPANIDETPMQGELPGPHAARLARGKAMAVSVTAPEALVLGSDTVVAVGRRILPKAEDEATARECLELISGRSHRVYTGVCLAGPEGRLAERLVETRVKVRNLSAQDIDAYIASGEWDGKAGGYGIQGAFAAHVVSIIGSHPSVVGLPLYETLNLLRGAGWKAA